LLRGALLIETLAGVQGKHIPPRCPDGSLLGRNPTATRVGIAGLERRFGTEHLSTPNISLPITVSKPPEKTSLSYLASS